ncbi:Na(+)/H(+) antiporter NhaP [Methyloligella halotolerans]|uniref:Na(+)/H(+) antiporter NhaP n=1 Tax=Methyloligella halotolerans TaxID=1177755 RepID=A0A1E2RXZ8_9HYPH|nr:sodium:proton antiporter [Methyloligella halotolerans]ODA67022.1 Na(+)/H(+) antiporter NhaP [Methyloligella halotolerans]
MSLFEIIAGLLVLTALFAWLNHRLIHLPHNVGLLVMGLAASLVLVGLELLLPQTSIFAELTNTIEGIDFSDALLHGMLGFLLFAGALHVDLGLLKARAWAVGLMATLGVVISTIVIAVGVWYAGAAIGFPITFAWALVFGALISPTDPIAVLAILKNAGVAETLEMDMAGESLFNDGVGVVLFTILLAAAVGGEGNGVDFLELGQDFLKEALGGGLLGFATGYITYRAMREIDDYPIEVLISLALVMGTYAIAEVLQVSGPIAVVVAGLLIGNRGAAIAMSETTRRHLFDFWTLIDEILNSLLFLLIGLEVLILQYDLSLAPFALAAVPIVLFGRLIAVSISVFALRPFEEFAKGTIPILTWGGVRGGISVALALSIHEVDEKPAILAATYCVALFTILVQGLTLPAVIRLFGREEEPELKL